MVLKCRYLHRRADICTGMSVHAPALALTASKCVSASIHAGRLDSIWVSVVDHARVRLGDGQGDG